MGPTRECVHWIRMVESYPLATGDRSLSWSGRDRRSFQLGKTGSESGSKNEHGSTACTGRPHRRICQHARGVLIMMLRTIDARIYQQVHFREVSISDVAHSVRRRFGSTIYLLCRGQALAVIWTGVPTPKGRSQENLENLAKISPIAQFIGEFLTLDSNAAKPWDSGAAQPWDPISLWLPAHKYDLDTWLPYGETSGRFIRTGFTKVYRDETSLCYSLSWRSGWSDAIAASCTELIRTWHREAVEPGFGGEKLAPSKLTFSKGKQGLSFEITNYAPVTYPWVELYLRLRADLPRRHWPMDMMYTPL